MNQDFLAAHLWALRTDFMVFYEKCFTLLEPGTEFLDNWHLHVIAEALRRVETGESKRLIINVPPRSGKSTLVSIAFTAWLLGRNPRLKIICTSYSESLAIALATSFRAIVKSDWYRHAFPAFQIERERDRRVETITTQRGYRYAVSISGPVLGRGADIIIGDDAMSPDAALSEAVRTRELNLWDTAHRTRLNAKRKGGIILISQRLHQDDLVGHALQHGTWDKLIIPAIASEPASYAISPTRFYDRAAGEVLQPEREPIEVLNEMRLAMGSMNFSAQYMQQPIPPEGNLVHREWLRYYKIRPDDFETLVSSWDTASTLSETSSYSVGMLWGSIGTDYYLLELVRKRFETPDLRRLMIETHEAWRPNALLVEDTELGRSLTQDLRRTKGWKPLLRRPKYDKIARLQVQLARFEAGRVHLPETKPWLSTYVEELLAFPYGAHNDQVDATSQVLDYFSSLIPVTQPIARRNIERRSVVRRSTEPGPRAGK